MLRAIVTPIFVLIVFLGYTIHSHDISMVEMRESNHEIIIYTKSGCPYCDRAMDFFKAQQIHFKQVDVTWDSAQWDKLHKQTGAATVPYIFIDNKYIGGCTDLLALNKSGKLEELLK